MEEKVIRITKTVSENLPADTVCIAITATATSPDSSTAVNLARSSAVEASAVFKNLNINDIKMSGESVGAVYDKGKLTGYRSVFSLNVNFPYDAYKLIDVVKALSACTCEWHIMYTLRDNSARSALLARAVFEARDDAVAIAAAAGVKLGDFVGAEYCSDEGRPMPMRAFLSDKIDIEPNSVKLSESVVCTWSIS